jgi:hypothetical protein
LQPLTSDEPELDAAEVLLDVVVEPELLDVVVEPELLLDVVVVPPVPLDAEDDMLVLPPVP